MRPSYLLILFLFTFSNLGGQISYLDQYKSIPSSTFELAFKNDGNLLIAHSFKEDISDFYFEGIEIITQNECEGIISAKRFSVPGQNMELTEMVKSNDGFFYLAGYYFESSDDRNTFLLKLNPDGSQSFFKLYTKPLNDYNYSLQITNDGNLMLFGASYLGGTFPFNFILRLDTSGNILSSKTYMEAGIWGRGLACSDGAVLARMGQNIYKINASGNLEWANQYFGTYYSSRPLEVDDGYVAVSYRLGASSEASFLYKLDFDGNLVWVSPGFQASGRPKIKQLANGNFIVQDVVIDENNSDEYHICLIEFSDEGTQLSNQIISSINGVASSIAFNFTLSNEESIAFASFSGTNRDTILIGQTNSNFELQCNDQDNFNQDTIKIISVSPKSISVGNINFEVVDVDLEETNVDLIGGRLCENISIDFPPEINDTTVCLQDDLVLDFSLTGATYLWQDGSTAPIFQVTTSGTYSVLIEKCNQSVERFVEVNIDDCPCLLEVPNAFTPDADGINDDFKILTDCLVSDFQLQIYNRWGQQVFQSTDAALAWNGTYKGSVLPSDVYIYKYQYRLSGNESKLEKAHGDISLIR